MDSLKQDPRTKVNVQCPQGHHLYVEGVAIGTLYKNYGIRLLESQRQIVKGNNFYYVHPSCVSTYKLTSSQYEMMTRKCKECGK